VLENQCFVCGFTREAYEDLPDFDGPSFDKHKDTDHNYWHYVYFFVYLKQKKEVHGAEASFVSLVLVLLFPFLFFFGQLTSTRGKKAIKLNNHNPWNWCCSLSPTPNLATLAHLL